MEAIFEVLLSSEILVTVGAFVIGILVDKYLGDGKNRKVFNIWTDALMETFDELELDENAKTATLYRLLEKIHNVPEDTQKVEQVILDKVGK